MTDRTLHIAISTCPNDTFAFHGLMTNSVDCRGLDLRVELMDIQQLNDGLFAGRFDIAKTSFHAALLLTEETVVLPAGSALGYGVGPLLLAACEGSTPTSAQQLTLCPGEHTTAALLFQLLYPKATRIRHTLFSDIMPLLSGGEADFGVCIHEGRFTFQEAGLHCVADLGEQWESLANCPLPLGGIVARRVLPDPVIADFSRVLRDSIDYGLNHRELTLPTMRKYAQEFSDDVLMQHVDLYVNEWTRDLGADGARALQELSDRSSECGLAKAEPLTIFCDS